jgi:hypothetical protein
MSLTKATPTKVKAPEPVSLSRPSGAEAPHTLPRYKEPKPFVTARSLKSFSVAAAIACGGSWALYRIMARRVDSLDAAQEAAAEALAGQKVTKQPSALGDAPASGVPVFAAPTSFTQLAELASSDSMSVAPRRNDSTASRQRPLLHEEAVSRARGMWNDALDALEASVVALERQHREYREACALEAMRAQVMEEHPGCEVTLRRA